jgi:CheY-like chemotaxis protein
MILGDPSVSHPSGALRVLVVEDNANGRATLCALLQLLGHKVEAAADGLQGVEKALAARPEVALIDIGLPRLNGYEVAQRLRAAFGRKIFLIAYTAYDQPEDHRRASTAGFDAYLVKPVALDDLDHALTVAARTLE